MEIGEVLDEISLEDALVRSREEMVAAQFEMAKIKSFLSGLKALSDDELCDKLREETLTYRGKIKIKSEPRQNEQATTEVQAAVEFREKLESKDQSQAKTLNKLTGNTSSSPRSDSITSKSDESKDSTNPQDSSPDIQMRSTETPGDGDGAGEDTNKKSQKNTEKEPVVGDGDGGGNVDEDGDVEMKSAEDTEKPKKDKEEIGDENGGGDGEVAETNNKAKNTKKNPEEAKGVAWDSSVQSNQKEGTATVPGSVPAVPAGSGSGEPGKSDAEKSEATDSSGKESKSKKQVQSDEHPSNTSRTNDSSEKAVTTSGPSALGSSISSPSESKTSDPEYKQPSDFIFELAADPRSMLPGVKHIDPEQPGSRTFWAVAPPPPPDKPADVIELD